LDLYAPSPETGMVFVSHKELGCVPNYPAIYKDTSMESPTSSIIFTPDNEPYLGRKLLYTLDILISAVMEQNTKIAPQTHTLPLTDHQQMACQVIPQAISIALSIRELIRQGYLFGAHVLLRALVERAAILLYLFHFPEEIEKWKGGWHSPKAPSLAKMFDKIQTKIANAPNVRGGDLTAHMNSLLHAKPDSAPWNIVSLGDDKIGYAASKILERPELCDDLCANMIPWLSIVPAMMAFYFPDQQA
jgi:hypothetical protein